MDRQEARDVRGEATQGAKERELGCGEEPRGQTPGDRSEDRPRQEHDRGSLQGERQIERRTGFGEPGFVSEDASHDRQPSDEVSM
jgi:hypothetical protein